MKITVGWITFIALSWVVWSFIGEVAGEVMLINGAKQEVLSVLHLTDDEKVKKFDVTVTKVYDANVVGMRVCIEPRPKALAANPELQRYKGCSSSPVKPITGKEFTDRSDATMIAANDLGKQLLTEKDNE